MNRTLIGCAFVAGLGLIAAATSYRRSPPAAPPRPAAPHVPLDIPRTHLELGEVWEDERFAWSLPVTDTGPVPVTLNQFVASCTCVSVTPDALEIAPGGTGRVNLVIDLRPKPTEPQDAPRHEFAVDLRGVARTAGQKDGVKVSWRLKGDVRLPVSAPRVVDFGEVSEFTRPVPPRVLPLAVPAGVTVTGATSDNPRVAARLGNSPSSLTLAPDPGPAPGPVEAVVELASATTGEDGIRLPPYRVRVSLWVVPDVEATPKAVLLGGRPVGDGLTETVRLRSVSGTPFVVEGVTTDSADVTATPDPAGGGATFAVRAAVRRAGEWKAAVTFRVTPRGHPPRDVVVPVSGHGFAAASGGTP